AAVQKQMPQALQARNRIIIAGGLIVGRLGGEASFAVQGRGLQGSEEQIQPQPLVTGLQMKAFTCLPRLPVVDPDPEAARGGAGKPQGAPAHLFPEPEAPRAGSVTA